MKNPLLPVLATAKAALTPFHKALGAFRAALGDDGDTITIVRPDTQQKDDVASPWHVVVFNDPVNLMSYVSMVIQRIFGYPASKATLMMLDVHQKGSCIVWTGEKERAEHYVQQLQSHQLLCQMRKATD